MPGPEQRRDPRYTVALAITLDRAGERLTGTSLNVSLGGLGLRVVAQPPLRVGERLQAQFALPDLSAPVRVEVEVRWLDPRDPEVVGVHFDSALRARDVWGLQQLFARLDRPGYA
jgi:hypothetical protein